MIPDLKSKRILKQSEEAGKLANGKATGAPQIASTRGGTSRRRCRGSVAAAPKAAAAHCPSAEQRGMDCPPRGGCRRRPRVLLVVLALNVKCAFPRLRVSGGGPDARADEDGRWVMRDGLDGFDSDDVRVDQESVPALGDRHRVTREEPLDECRPRDLPDKVARPLPPETLRTGRVQRGVLSVRLSRRLRLLRLLLRLGVHLRDLIKQPLRLGELLVVVALPRVDAICGAPVAFPLASFPASSLCFKNTFRFQIGNHSTKRKRAESFHWPHSFDGTNRWT